jgi:myosin heavy subunit
MLDKIKGLSKKTKIIIAVVVAFLVVVIAVSCASSDGLKGYYDEMVQAVCNDDYELAKTYYDYFSEDYKEFATITKFVDIADNFDENDTSSYSSVLTQLDEISFENELLSEKYNEFVEKVKSLNDTYLQNQEDAQKIIDEINSISNGNINDIELDDEELIKQARKSYDNASDEVKAMVTNVAILTQSEERLEALKTYKANAEAVEKKIDEIGTVTLNSESSINDAQSAYNKLSDEEKSYVSNADKLSEASSQYKELEEEQKKQTTTTTTTSSYTSSATYYWVSSGEVYHITENCRTLSRSKNIQSGSTPPSGRRACKVCA